MRVLYDRQLGLLLLDFKADFFEPRNTGSYETAGNGAFRSTRVGISPARSSIKSRQLHSRQIDRTWKRFLAGQFTRENAFYLASFPLRVVSASSSFSKSLPSPVVTRGPVEKFTTLAVVYT